MLYGYTLANDHDFTTALGAPDMIFQDAPSTRSFRWPDRPQAAAILAQIQPGDELVARDEDVFRDKLDWVTLPAMLNAMGMTMHMVGGTTGTLTTMPRGADLEQVLQAVSNGLTAFQEQCRANIRQGIKAKRDQGLRYTGEAPYGSSWGKDGRLVPDLAEQAVIERIVALRDQERLSWYAIAARLLRNKVVASTGREWSPSRVRRAYLAAKRRAADGEES